MKTLFFNRLEPTRDQHALFNWIVAKSGITPLDVMISRRKGAPANFALANFDTAYDASRVLRSSTGVKFNRQHRGVQDLFALVRLNPPPHPRSYPYWLTLHS